MNEGKGRRSMASLSTSQLASSSNTAGRGRIYPIESAGMTKLVTREIAALDFLLGIPMEGEEAIVQNGWHRMQQQPTGMWWEKFVQRPQRRGSGESVLEQPTRDLTDEIESAASVPKPSIALQTRAGGRRLDGDKALKVRIPQSGFARTRQRSIARQAAIREFEARTAHGSPRDPAAGGLLLGRVFFSAKDNYPVGVFSVLRYEPKREEAARRRRKVEAGGGGGTSFEVPQRDWRKCLELCSHPAFVPLSSGLSIDDWSYMIRVSIGFMCTFLLRWIPFCSTTIRRFHSQAVRPTEHFCPKNRKGRTCSTAS